jgi:hypothetical protein
VRAIDAYKPWATRGPDAAPPEGCSRQVAVMPVKPWVAGRTQPSRRSVVRSESIQDRTHPDADLRRSVVQGRIDEYLCVHNKDTAQSTQHTLKQTHAHGTQHTLKANKQHTHTQAKQTHTQRRRQERAWAQRTAASRTAMGQSVKAASKGVKKTAVGPASSGVNWRRKRPRAEANDDVP